MELKRILLNKNIIFAHCLNQQKNLGKKEGNDCWILFFPSLNALWIVKERRIFVDPCQKSSSLTIEKKATQTPLLLEKMKITFYLK